MLSLKSIFGWISVIADIIDIFSYVDIDIFSYVDIIDIFNYVNITDIFSYV